MLVFILSAVFPVMQQDHCCTGTQDDRKHTGKIQYKFFLGRAREGCSFFKKNIPPAILFFVPKNKCVCSALKTNRHIVFAVPLQLALSRPPQILITGGSRRAILTEKTHVPALARQRPSPILRTDLSPSSARFSGDVLGTKLPHSLICNSGTVYPESGKMSRCFTRESLILPAFPHRAAGPNKKVPHAVFAFPAAVQGKEPAFHPG